MQDLIVVDNDDRFSLAFTLYNDVLRKEALRYTENGYPIFRFIGSAEIIDKQGEVIDINAFKEIMPIMAKQGARINGEHTTQPAGEFTDWGFLTVEGHKAIWLDVAVYTDYPSQKENLRKLLLPEGDPEKICGISVGGTRLAKHRECNDQFCYLRTTKIEGWEWSLVPEPANPLALNITDEFLMAVQKSLSKSKSVKAKAQIRSQKGRFTKKDDCPCGKHKDKKEKKKLEKMQCPHCGEEYESDMEKEDDDEYAMDMDEEDSETRVEGGEDTYPDDEMREGDEETEVMQEEGEDRPIDADLEKPHGNGYPEEMPSDSEGMAVNGGNDMSEGINQVLMQLDKLFSALNIEKGAETPDTYTDDKGNVYKLEKKSDPKDKDEVIKGLETKIAELQKQASTQPIEPVNGNLAKQTDETTPVQEKQPMDIEQRLNWLKTNQMNALKNNRIVTQ